jgi:DNA-binding XRE family transcriptional regulator
MRRQQEGKGGEEMKNGIKKHRLGLLIEDKPYSQAVLVDYMNESRPEGTKPVNRVRISLLENGKAIPELWELEKMCEFLKCKPEDLYTNTVLGIIQENAAQ